LELKKSFINGSDYRFILEDVTGNSYEMPQSMSPEQVKRMLDHLASGGFVHTYEKVSSWSKNE
jgi:hypothetical protein